jgi:hypothetical protein
VLLKNQFLNTRPKTIQQLLVRLFASNNLLQKKAEENDEKNKQKKRKKSHQNLEKN